MAKKSNLPSGFGGGSHDYGPKGTDAVVFWVGLIVVFLVMGAGVRENNILLIAIGVVLALMFAARVKVWYTPRK